MAAFRMIGGTHVEDGKYYDQPGSLIESRHELDKLFANSFVRADANPQALAVPGLAPGTLPGQPDPRQPVRRTAASEAQALQQRAKGNLVPIGGAPGDEVDEENAGQADELAEDFTGQVFDPQKAEPGGPAVDVGVSASAVRPQKASASKAAGKSSAASKAPQAAPDEPEGASGEEGDEPTLENVSGEFPKAKDAGVEVWKDSEDGTYFVYKAGTEETVGEAKGYGKKRDATSFVNKTAQEAKK